MLWSEFLAEIRVEVGDTAATPRFTDAVLWSYTRDAIIDISRYPSLARRVDRVTLTVDPVDPCKFVLPDDFLSELYVECPLDTVLEPRQMKLGQRRISGRLSTYFTDRAYLYLNGVPTGDVVLTYLASHPYPANADDLTFVFTNPQRDNELVRLYVLGRVLKWMRVQQSKLDRFKATSGARDDNPMFPETIDLEKTYDEAISERMPSGGVLLYRPGKK